MTDSVFEAQLRRQLYEARQEVTALRADRARLEDEIGPLRQRLADALDRAGLAERQAAAGLPLICSDERHQAKVAALEAELGLRRGPSQRGCGHRDPKRLGARPSDLATVCACGAEVFPSPIGRRP